MTTTSPHVTLAMQAICEYVERQKILPVPDGLPEEFRSPAAAFVSLKKFGELRGCIGTIEPVRMCLAEEIVMNGISAATQDPRFLPVEPEELTEIICSVDVLTCPELIDDRCLLDPARYGVIVQCGERRGLLLPDLEGVDTIEDQIDIARRKACIPDHEPLTLYRFEVKRYF